MEGSSESASDRSNPECASSNRRGRARHKISFNLGLRDGRTNVPLRVNAYEVISS
jgi:hypothetical protein